MADQKKGKTKAAILRELESIKGLLLEEDDIPLLQEVIDPDEAMEIPNPATDAEELADLQKTYQDLVRTRESLSTDDLSTNNLSTDNQSTDELPSAEDTADKKPEQNRTQRPDADPGDPKHRSQAQASLFDEPNESSSGGDKGPQRPTPAKASGENPFLPAHIRARLNSNRASTPQFERATLNAQQPSPFKQKTRTTPDPDISRGDLIDELAQAFLPDIEKALKQRLRNMTDEQLKLLAREEKGEGHSDP